MKKKLITNSFQETVIILKKLMVKADDSLENMRIIYKKQDDPIIYLNSAFDFIDLNLDESSIKIIKLFQLID